MSEKQCNLIGGGTRALVDLIYPVGRTIMCRHNPAEDYPWQTWEQDCVDRFPVGAGNKYALDQTGGEETHTLSVAEMPSHSHTVNSHTHMYSNATGVQGHALTVNEIPYHEHPIWLNEYYNGTYAVSGWHLRLTQNGAIGNIDGIPANQNAANTKGIGGNASHSHGLWKADANTGGSAPGTSSSGANNAHNNMPPYKGVYFWTRTA